MANRDSDFLKRVKVSDEHKEVENTSPDRNVYTCLKLMEDTNKIEKFLLSMRQQEVDGKKISTKLSTNYFYNICAQLGYAEFDFRKGRINGNEFDRKIDEVCKNSNLDFSYLMETVKQISLLEKTPNQEERIKLVQEIENKAIEQHEKLASEREND